MVFKFPGDLRLPTFAENSGHQGPGQNLFLKQDEHVLEHPCAGFCLRRSRMLLPEGPPGAKECEFFGCGAQVRREVREGGGDRADAWDP